MTSYHRGGRSTGVAVPASSSGARRSRRRGWLAGLLVAVALGPGALAAQQGAVTGTVRPAEGAMGLQAGAVGLATVQVTAHRPDGSEAAGALTNEQGAYRLSLPAGTYTVVFSVPGWETHRAPGTVVTAGEATLLNVMLRQVAFDLNPLTVSASRGVVEKAIEAPAAVQVRSTQDIVEQPALTVADHVRGMAAVDVIKTGVQGNYVTIRGFNNIFSGATLTLTDNRIGSVPSLRANVLHLNPTTNLDIERVEVVLGPGSALYGPNATNGVIHSITKSPIDYPGGAISVAAGAREQRGGSIQYSVDTDLDDVPEEFTESFESSAAPVYHVEGRYAHRFGDRFGVKLSAQYFGAEEYRFLDREELEQQRLADACIAAGLVRGAATCPAFTAGLGSSADEIDTFQASVRNVAGGRNNDLERFSGDVRADWRPAEDVAFIVSGGRNLSASSVDLTGLGAGQVVDWAYNYLQARALFGNMFAQVFFNQSDNSDTYLLRSGRPLVDRSTLLVGQLQNQTQWGATNLTYGADVLRTVPRTDGTINGRNEDDDEISELGAYLQTQTSLGRKFDLTLAARGDYHSILEDPVFSPRAALVFTPVVGQNFRATYNRAFSTPSTLNLFLDISGGSIPLPAGLRYDVRAQGTTADGLHFRYGDNGLPMHRNPFAQFAGLSPAAYQETSAAVLWMEIAAVVALQNPGLGDFMDSLEPTDADIAVEARTLDVQSQVFVPTPGGIQGITDISRVAPSITNTFELGYKGLIGDRLLLGANAYHTLIDDYTSALRISTPNVFLNRADVEAYLIANGLDPATAAGAALAIGGDGTADNPGIPIGVVTPVEAGGSDPALVLTYRNLGRVELFGADVTATLILSPLWEATVGGAWVSDDTFTANEGLSTQEDIPLNAPTLKGTAALRYRNTDAGLTGQVRARVVNGFPANSAVYAGDVDGYGVVDLTLGYRIAALRDMTLTLDVSNVLNTGYQTFIGSPELGRFALLRLIYEF